jgi:phosphatidylglycerol:prolipoprotein diacylglycerol transferase
MFPVVVAFGPFTISSIGLFIALAFVMGSFEIWKRAKEEHYEDSDIFDIVFLTFLGGLIGGRLFHILYNFGDFGFDIGRWLNLAYSNQIAWLGFVVGVMYMLYLVYKRKKFSYFEFLDVSVFGVIVAQVLVRVGQFLDGSYLGSVTVWPIGLHFPGVEGGRFPVQLIEVVVLIGLFFYLRWLNKHYRLFSWYQDSRGKAHPGFLWLVYMGSLCVLYFGLDFITERETVLWMFSVRQFVCVVLAGVVWLMFWLRSGRRINTSFLSNLVDSDDVKPIRKPRSSSVGRRKKFVRRSKMKAGRVV